VDIIPLSLKWERVRGPPGRVRSSADMQVADCTPADRDKLLRERFERKRADRRRPSPSGPIRRSPAVPRALIQRGDRTLDQCSQFSISIFDGKAGLTVRFEGEFRRFLDRGEAAPTHVSCVGESSAT
jgi:hypothetical protein